jgi:hypothetical protein
MNPAMTSSTDKDDVLFVGDASAARPGEQFVSVGSNQLAIFAHLCLTPVAALI